MAHQSGTPSARSPATFSKSGAALGGGLVPQHRSAERDKAPPGPRPSRRPAFCSETPSSGSTRKGGRDAGDADGRKWGQGHLQPPWPCLLAEELEAWPRPGSRLEHASGQ